MNTVAKLFVFSVMVTLVSGCAGMDVKETDEPLSSDPVVATQERHIHMLNFQIAEVTERIASVKDHGVNPDPVSEEIRKTVLAAEETFLEQRKLLLDHCELAKKLLLEAKANPDRKTEIQAQWAQHQEQLLSTLEEIGQKEDDLKRKRLGLELQLVQDALK